MKHIIKIIAICICLFLTGNVLAQKKLLEKRTRANLGTTMQVAKMNATQWKLQPYSAARVVQNSMIGQRKLPLPKKIIDINEIYEDPDWGWGYIYKVQTKAPEYIKGVEYKTNIHYFKNIRNNVVTGFVDDFDHIIVTDTLYAPTKFINTDRKPRRNLPKRSYIKIIANCIIYEKPIGLTSTKLRTQTDYVFSAANIFYKSKDNNLQKMKVGSSPPFVKVLYGEIKLHKDPFIIEEKTLVNRLFIGIMDQISTELTNEKSDWKKDKLLIEFQKYRHKVMTGDVLRRDTEYKDKYNQLCNSFDSNQENALERDREVNGIRVLVAGKVKDLDKSPFKYYAIPSKAILAPVMDENTGESNKLGDLIFKATGDSKIALTMGVKLGYQKDLFEKANKEIKKYGFSIEKNVPKEVIFITEQPLQIRGQKTGKIIPIDSNILELKLELQDENLSLIKLLTKRNDVTFELVFKAYESRKEYRQEALFEVSDDIIKQIDYENMVDEFNVIETNTITDLVKITSNLKSDLGAEYEGVLNYIEVFLEFQFDNDKVVYRGPFKMSSASVLGSEKSILFVKHSENYSMKVSGKAYYDNGTREIKENVVITSPFIELQEDIFKNE